MRTMVRRRRRDFVLRKALENKAKPIVVINKIDRENARPHKVLDMVFDLFVELKATDEQLDFPIIYASAKNGFAMRELHENNEDMTPLFEAIVKHVPPPTISPEPYLQMLVSNLDYSDYLGPHCAWPHRQRTRGASAIRSFAFIAMGAANARPSLRSIPSPGWGRWR